jgi:hypothetical protein
VGEATQRLGHSCGNSGGRRVFVVKAELALRHTADFWIFLHGISLSSGERRTSFFNDRPKSYESKTI